MDNINISDNLSYKARTADFDRYFCTLFARKSVRESLFSLILFNSEIAKIRRVVSEPTIGHIRLQWWRDAIEGIYRGNVLAHDVVRPLFLAIKKHNYNKMYFHQLIDGRERDLQDVRMQTMSELVNYAEETSAPLLYLFLETILQNKAAENIKIFKYTREIGISWALTGLIRAWPYHASEGYVTLPTELLEDSELVISNNTSVGSDKLCKALAEVGMIAKYHLKEAAKFKNEKSFKDVKVIHLLATLCEAYLNRLSRNKFNPYLPESTMGPLRKQILLSRTAFFGL